MIGRSSNSTDGASEFEAGNRSDRDNLRRVGDAERPGEDEVADHHVGNIDGVSVGEEDLGVGAKRATQTNRRLLWTNSQHWIFQPL